MQTSQTLLFALLISTSAFAQAHYHGVSHAKPLTYDQLPAECQHYFKRADTCFAKANQAATTPAREVVKFLVQALPAATPTQRVEMCKVAERDFPARVSALKCE
ncbi:hypothetical protein [Kingella sp. (in: b-proteobacteria)]|uniref:hypothetical protein n=1 Tax=Kingella sp. (in: b-proteobacteria) TaxID=2020713 RepID=UPI0026DB0916|nr:hypothetical protein [Kingella sp. (in: b-proteobacteria)]MDO4657950.1 hypothetical protein [Kingella sp. (in: b-proteobacteria)]